MHFSIAVWRRGPSAKNLNAMECRECLLIISGDVHIERRVSLAIFHQSKKKPHVFFPIMPAKEERNVLWFGFFKWRKPGGKKKIQYIFGEKQPKLARNKFRTWISSFSPSCFVWRCATFWDATKSRQRENFPATSLAAQVSQHFALKGNFSGNSWDSDFKEVCRFNMASPKSPRFWSDQTSKPLKAERLFVCFHQWYTHPEFTNMAGWRITSFK